MTGVTAVSAVGSHTMILKNDGSLWATGSNTMGQLGIGSAPKYISTPVKVMTGVSAVSAGELHTMVLKTDGSLWATGHNYYGELCTGDTISTMSFKRVAF
jgi:alpha-tubulin suppressor-like RCC1 family protein